MAAVTWDRQSKALSIPLGNILLGLEVVPSSPIGVGHQHDSRICNRARRSSGLRRVFPRELLVVVGHH